MLYPEQNAEQLFVQVPCLQLRKGFHFRLPHFEKSENILLAANLMQILFCFTSILAKILLHVIGLKHWHCLPYFSSFLPHPVAINTKNYLFFGTKRLMKFTPGACIIKLITAVIYRFCNKLTLDQAGKACQGQTLAAYYGNRKLRP